jgi:4-amino-4-deoxy-L-arabinose transferase-like glycosyltransferase
MHGKTEPLYFFLPIIIGGTIPWSVYLIKAWNVEKIKEWLFRKDENKLLIVWFGFVFLFYTFSSSKLPTYIAPVFLPLALFAGAIICKYEEELSPVNGGRKIFYRLAVIFQSLLIIIALLLPPILKPYSDAEKGLVVMISQNWWLCSLLPMFVAILMTFIPDLETTRLRRRWFVSIYMLCTLFLAGMLFPLNDFLAPYRSARVAKEAIARNVPPGQSLYQYRVNFYGIDFYNHIRTPIVDDFGELGDGILKLNPEEINKYFLMTKDFFALIAEKKDVYCITQHSERLKEIKGKFPLTEILWENGAFYLLRIRSL